MLFRDIGERKRAEETLREAHRRKNEFLAVLGHELRNPLAPLRSGVDLLELSRGKPELIEGIRVIMRRQLGHLVHLVDDLLAHLTKLVDSAAVAALLANNARTSSSTLGPSH